MQILQIIADFIFNKLSKSSIYLLKSYKICVKQNLASLRLCERIHKIFLICGIQKISVNSIIRGYNKKSLQFSTEIHIRKRELLNTLANYNSTIIQFKENG